MNKTVSIGIAAIIGISTLFLGLGCVSADYTDREVSRAVESLVTRGDREDRKPTLEKLQSVLPKALERFEGNPSATNILKQIEVAVVDKLSICISEEVSQGFSSNNLITNTNIRSVPLDEVLSGGPPKDGIPALHDPAFITTYDAQQSDYLQDSSEGIIIQDETSAKFYPYNILNWHEIVNDTIGDQHVAITFCPLCGTAIVFDREFDGEVVEFGVSGLLYNSNLLMYDNITESLRSQAVGKAVVGFYTDFQLSYIDSDVQTFEVFAAQYPDGLVLSDDTGYERNYSIDSPYGDYDSNDDLYFPVANIDATLPKKTLLYVVNDTEKMRSVAFIKDSLLEKETATLDADGITYTASVENGMVTIMRDDQELNNFVQMRFSWTAHDNDARYVWGLDE